MMEIRPPKWLPISLATVGWSLRGAQAAWAVQSHGGGEGLVSHQIGHILFAVGLLSVLVMARRERWSGKAWAAFRWFLVLAVVWCALTFTGHFLDHRVDSSQLVRVDGRVRLLASSLVDWLYYLSRLDHLLWVPALLCLWRALVLWDCDAEESP